MTDPDVIARLREAISAVRVSDPEGWPETVVSVTAGVAGLDVGAMNLLADAAAMAAGTAHELSLEAAEEDDPGAGGVDRN